jgi:diguanylate cyclase (GGDEF)-like protein/PAS domain S-box-containing protein
LIQFEHEALRSFLCKEPGMGEKKQTIKELQEELDAARAELQKAEAEINQLRHQNELIMNSLGEGIYWLDLQGNITYVNEAAARIFGYEQQELVGQPHQMILQGSHPDAASGARHEGREEAQRRREVIVHDVNDDTFWRKDGTSFPVEYVRTSIQEQDELIGTIITFRDITKRKELEQNLQTLATTDGLTKLFNRLYFTAKLEEEFQRSERYSAPLSLMLLDIDNFKSINDTYGHQAGDAYLQALAALVSGSIRLVDVAARYGGEELTIILPHTGSEAAVVMAERIRKMVEAFELAYGGKKIRTTISIGVATHMPGEAKTTDEFLTDVDNALYAAKRGGRNRVVLHGEQTD